MEIRRVKNERRTGQGRVDEMRDDEEEKGGQKEKKGSKIRR